MRRLRPILVLAVSAAFVLISHAAEARARNQHVSKHDHGVKKSSAQVRKYRLAKSTYFAKRYSHAKKSRTAVSRSISLAGVTPVLAAKALLDGLVGVRWFGHGLSERRDQARQILEGRFRRQQGTQPLGNGGHLPIVAEEPGWPSINKF